MIRAARSEDFSVIRRLYRQLHPDDPVLPDDTGRSTFDTILDTPGLTLLVLEAGGVVVATTYLNVIPNMTRSA